MAKIQVNQTDVSIIKIDDVDYISLTDMLKAKDGEFFFSNWLRNRNTVEFLGIWEKVNNPDFNCVEFDIIKSQAGLNSYRLSAKEWSEKTGAIGIISKTGRCFKYCPFWHNRKTMARHKSKPKRQYPRLRKYKSINLFV